MTHEGEGIVREGKAAFVAGSLPGERIRFRRAKRHKQYDDAELLEVLEPAADRVTPRCAHFGLCGGCALQHLDPAAQILAKQRELQDNLERIAQAVPEQWFQPMRGPVWNYRRRARLGVKYVAKKGRVLVGFRERLAPYVAQLTQCEVLSDPAGKLITPLADMIMTLSIRERLPQIEVAVADNAVALVMRVMAPPSTEDLATLRAFEAAHGLRLYLQPAGLDSVHRLPAGPDGRAEEDPLHYRLPAYDLTLDFNPTDFIQVNGAINQALVSRAVELLDPAPGSAVLDLYCGLGNFTLALARGAGRVVGVEGDRELVRRGGENARRNGIANAEFHMADLMQPLPGGGCMVVGTVSVCAFGPAARGSAGNVANRRTFGAEARAVYFVPSGQPRQGHRSNDPRTRVQAARRGRARHVPAYNSRRVACRARAGKPLPFLMPTHRTLEP
jgi:23S rRNA (uracil1939-C5)-methyltransferase